MYQRYTDIRIDHELMNIVTNDGVVYESIMTMVINFTEISHRGPITLIGSLFENPLLLKKRALNIRYLDKLF